MPSTDGPQHRHRRNHKFPPQHHTDLRGSDISLLAPLFGPTPSRTSSLFAAHDADIRKKIGALPPHLRSRIALLSTFCSTHKQLNSLPVSSILTCIQDKITPQALFHWAPVEQSSWLDKKTLALLEEMNTIWQRPATFQTNYGRAPNPKSGWLFVDHRCAACRLSTIANNVPGIVALGACIIARLNPVNWKKSKRIQWFEKWIAASVESHPRAEPEVVVKAMWECGVRLYNAMAIDQTPSRRAYIDDFVSQTRTPLVPSRSNAQQTHVANTEKLMNVQDEDELSDSHSIRTIRHRSPLPTAPTPKAPTKSELPESDKFPTRYVPSTDFFAQAQKSFHEIDSGRTLLNNPALIPPPQTAPARRPTSSANSPPLGKRVTSSIYSRATDDDDDGDDKFHGGWDSQEDWFRTSVLEESEFIDSYGTSLRGVEGGIIEPNEFGFI